MKKNNKHRRIMKTCCVMMSGAMLLSLSACSPADAVSSIKDNISSSINKIKSLPRNPNFDDTIESGGLGGKHD